MYELIDDKFRRNVELKRKLIGTGNIELIEGNTWKDTFWGVYKGKGRNELGKILMEIRATFMNHKNIFNQNTSIWKSENRI